VSNEGLLERSPTEVAIKKILVFLLLTSVKVTLMKLGQKGQSRLEQLVCSPEQNHI